MSEPVTHKLEVPGAVLRYDVRESEPRGRPVLAMIGSPMAAAQLRDARHALPRSHGRHL